MIATLVSTLGELISRFLAHERNQALAGELATRTLGEYVEEVTRVVELMKPSTPASGLRPEHFSAYVQQVINRGKRGRHAPKRV